MSLSRNLVAATASSAWTALVGLAVVPIYLKYIGIGAYGLVGFLATLQSLFSLLDFGLSTAINRETARYAAAGQLGQSADLLHTLAIIYWGAAASIGVCISLAAPFIAGYWLQTEHLSHENVSQSVMMMGFIIACRWPIGLYQGALMGAQQLVITSGINIAMATLGSVGAVIILAFISPTVQALFLWQAGVGLLYALTIRWAAWRTIGRKGTGFDIAKLRHIWRFSIGISAITITALIFMQLDKIILSRTLKLEDFGRYMLATNIAGALYMLIMPVYNVVYPRFSGLVSVGEDDKLAILYRTGTRVLSAVLFPIATILAIFSKNLVIIWTGNTNLAVEVAPLISLLAIGSALHGVMFFPYAVQLAYGKTKLPVQINTLLVIIQAPLVVILSLSYGALGGAVSWLILHILYVLLGSWITHHNLLKDIGQKWLFTDVGIPLILSALTGYFEYYISNLAGLSTHIKLFYGVITGLFTILCAFVIFPDMRSMLHAILQPRTAKVTTSR